MRHMYVHHTTPAAYGRTCFLWFRSATANLERNLQQNLKQNLMQNPPRLVFYRTSWRADTNKGTDPNIYIIIIRAVRSKSNNFQPLEVLH